MTFREIVLNIVEVIVGWLLPWLFYVKGKLKSRGKKRLRPEGVVILHHPGRGPWAPSMIPFALKVETYLRMANIPYKSYPGLAMSPKGKFPWIEYNGTTLGDSALILKLLNAEFRLELNKHLTTQEKATARAFRIMGEDHAYWTGACYRWWLNYDQKLLTETMNFPHPLLTWYIGRRMTQLCWAQGMGRHSRQEIRDMMIEDLQAISDFIGDKQFLMGDEPCEEDCGVFGILAMIRWDMPGTGEVTLVEEKFSNIRDYCDRMKDRFWPDWDECITWGGTRTPRK